MRRQFSLRIFGMGSSIFLYLRKNISHMRNVADLLVCFALNLNTAFRKIAVPFRLGFFRAFARHSRAGRC
jgi:hypothetical protein